MISGRVVVAMSGGVDSSVTAALLKEEGYQVIGVTLCLGNMLKPDSVRHPDRSPVVDACRVAQRLGILHYVLNCEYQFYRDVIIPFAAAYNRGETPVPCVLCNKTIKFRELLRIVRLLEAENLATGHYVRRRDGPDGPELWQSRDLKRDQSYFLFATTRSQLSLLRFPIGELASKEETRSHARRLGLSVADKQDSQDICFVPGSSNYSQVVCTVQPKRVLSGNIVHIDGQILGRHPGVVYYTVGQRRGLHVSNNTGPLYVVRLDPDTQQVVVGPRSALARSRLMVNNVNWLGMGMSPSPDGQALTVRLRSRHVPVPAVVYGRAGGSALVLLAEPFIGVAPGQACVFYRGNQILGGGWICHES